MLAAAALLLPLAAARAAAPALDDVIALERPDLGLTFALEGLDAPRSLELRDAGPLQAAWRAKLGRSNVDVLFALYDRDEQGVEHPQDVISIFEQNPREGEEDAPRFQEQRAVPGAYGYVPYAVLGVRTRYLETKPESQTFLLAGVLAKKAWSVEVRAEPALVPAERETLEAALLASVSYEGAVEVPEWTDEELEARWKRDAPADAVDDLVSKRTEHYLILSNCGKGSMKKFAEKMEECYAEIRAVYPFDELPSERLLPVFLFRTAEQYYAYCKSVIGWTDAQARTSKGVAWKDFYATWYDAPKDPVHVHEATHQIFANRLFLTGGGSWFQEGVAEYMATSKNDRKAFKRLAKDDRATPLAKFVTIPSLLMSSGGTRQDGTNEAHEGYLQAASLIEFLREDDWCKDRFQDLVHELGRVPGGDVEAIDAVLGRVLGTDLAGLEQRFLDYWRSHR